MGDYSIFIKSPICVVLILVSILSLVYPVIKEKIKQKRSAQ